MKPPGRTYSPVRVQGPQVFGASYNFQLSEPDSQSVVQGRTGENTPALFPEKAGQHRGIDPIERVVLSLGMSIAIVPLIGLGLNYTPWGIRLEPVLISLLIFVAGTSIAGTYRWKKLEIEKTHIIEFEVRWPALGESRLDKALSIALAASIIAAIGTLIWAISTPKIGERFTEFYMLG